MFAEAYVGAGTEMLGVIMIVVLSQVEDDVLAEVLNLAVGFGVWACCQVEFGTAFVI